MRMHATLAIQQTVRPLRMTRDRMPYELGEMRFYAGRLLQTDQMHQSRHAVAFIESETADRNIEASILVN